MKPVLWQHKDGIQIFAHDKDRVTASDVSNFTIPLTDNTALIASVKELLSVLPDMHSKVWPSYFARLQIERVMVELQKITKESIDQP